MREKKLIIVILLLVLISSWTIFLFSYSNILGSGDGETVPENAVDRSMLFDGEYSVFLSENIRVSRVIGDSMEPTFSDGDSVLWVEASARKINIGDIIIYEDPLNGDNEKISHRVVDKISENGYKFETQGDNVGRTDAERGRGYYVTENDLKGLVIGITYQK